MHGKQSWGRRSVRACVERSNCSVQGLPDLLEEGREIGEQSLSEIHCLEGGGERLAEAQQHGPHLAVIAGVFI